MPSEYLCNHLAYMAFIEFLPKPIGYQRAFAYEFYQGALMIKTNDFHHIIHAVAVQAATRCNDYLIKSPFL